MYQALYRKWRPKTFEDVVGQDSITGNLRRQVAEGRTSHAYLFTGTRGTGKTTCAKILAKAVNCENPQDGNPCCQCPACLGIENGNFPDVTELDAASNNGVDQVRALREEAIFSPAYLKKRVYIIDEVHMLSVAAFNALLKILEEPPEHLMFILATTELYRIPATILSRCQRYAFKRILPGDIVTRLTYVAAQEHIELTEDGAELLSRLADGALRDALSLLDQCAASGGRVDSAAVLEMLGLAGGFQTAELLEHVLRRDAPAALIALDRLYREGKDVGALLGELSVLVRDLLLRQTASERGNALLSGTYDSAALERLAPLAQGKRLLYLAATLQKASAELYYSSERRIDAELCLLRMCDEGLSGDLTALNARIQRLEDALAGGQGLPAAPAGPPKLAARPTASAPAAKPVPPPPPKPAPIPPASPAPAPSSMEHREEAELPPLPEEPPPEREAPGERIFDIPEPFFQEIESPSARPSEAPEPADPAPAPPMTREAPAMKPVSADGTAIPSGASAPGTSQGAETPVDPGWWRAVAERSKGRLSPMYRAFLDMCAGVLNGELLTLYAPDEITQGRLNNDRFLGVIAEEAGAARAVIQVGEPPQRSAEDNFKNLVKFGSQFDNIKIKKSDGSQD